MRRSLRPGSQGPESADYHLDAIVEEDFGRRASQLRLGTLVRLRWLACAGQLAALLIAHFALGAGFLFMPSLGCVVASAAFNLYLSTRFPIGRRLHDDFATAILAFDIGQLAALLFFTGGLANPFAVLFLAPIMISAVSQPWRETVKLLAFSLLCVTALEFFHSELTYNGVPLDPPQLYEIGLWASIGVSAGFVALYGNQVAGEARQLSSALAATELTLARAQHLSQLDGLAAAAAHELGTPLATVAVIVHELAAQADLQALCGEDLALAETQLARCRTILQKLSSPGKLASEARDDVPLETLLEEVVAPHRLQGVEIKATLAGKGAQPLSRRNPALIYGLDNLVSNAVGFAGSSVSIEGSWSAETIQIVIRDDGPGFPPQVLRKWGEPYISDRAGARRGDGEAVAGLGLGLFIAKALLERTGAELKIENARAPERGALVAVSWTLPVSSEKTGFWRPGNEWNI